MARVRGRVDPVPVLIQAHRPDSDKWPERDVNNPDWRYSLEWRDRQSGELQFATRLTAQEAFSVFLKLGYAQSGINSRLSVARMQSRDPENTRGANMGRRRTSLDDSDMIGTRAVSTYTWCTEHKRPHFVVPRDAQFESCRKHHRRLMVIARESEGPF